MESKYASQHQAKVRQQDQRVDMFVKSHERMLPAAIEAQQKRIKDPARTKMVRSDSGGLVALMDGDDRRKEGTT